MEGWVGILVASIRGKNDKVQYEKLRVTKLRQSGTQPPRNQSKRGVELIFHSFPSPPLHPSLHQVTRLSPPRPCAPSTSSLPYLPRIFRDIW